MGWLKIIVFWFVINSFFAYNIASIISLSDKTDFITLLIICEINTNIIGTFTATIGYITKIIFRKSTFLKILISVNITTISATLIGCIIVIYLWSMLIEPEKSAKIIVTTQSLLLPILLYTFLGTNISKLIEYIIEKRIKTKLKQYENSKSETIHSENQALNYIPIREKNNHYNIPFKNIIYISSAGKHSLIHTEERDYETAMLLKEIELLLPLNIFLRIHKQYIINMDYFLTIQYYMGGRYMAILNDSDDNMLPVGRKFFVLLKEKMNSNMSFIPL